MSGIPLFSYFPVQYRLPKQGDIKGGLETQCILFIKKLGSVLPTELCHDLEKGFFSLSWVKS